MQQLDDIAVAVTAVGGEHRSRPARRTVKLHAEGRKPLIFRLGVVDIKADVDEPRIAHAAFDPDALGLVILEHLNVEDAEADHGIARGRDRKSTRLNYSH